jgi:hypothetical protein
MVSGWAAEWVSEREAATRGRLGAKVEWGKFRFRNLTVRERRARRFQKRFNFIREDRILNRRGRGERPQSARRNPVR